MREQTFAFTKERRRDRFRRGVDKFLSRDWTTLWVMLVAVVFLVVSLWVIIVYYGPGR